MNIPGKPDFSIADKQTSSLWTNRCWIPQAKAKLVGGFSCPQNQRSGHIRFETNVISISRPFRIHLSPETYVSVMEKSCMKAQIGKLQIPNCIHMLPGSLRLRSSGDLHFFEFMPLQCFRPSRDSYTLHNQVTPVPLGFPDYLGDYASMFLTPRCHWDPSFIDRGATTRILQKDFG